MYLPTTPLLLAPLPKSPLTSPWLYFFILFCSMKASAIRTISCSFILFFPLFSYCTNIYWFIMIKISTINSPSGSAVEARISFILKFQRLHHVSYPLRLSKARGQTYTAATLFSQGPSCPLPLLWPLPSLHSFSVKQIGTSSVFHTDRREQFRLGFPHVPRTWIILVSGISLSMRVPSVPQLTFFDNGSSMAAWPTQLSCAPVIRSLSRCGICYARDWRA